MLFCLVPALLYLFVCCESVGFCGTQMNISWVSEAWDGKYILIPIMRQKASKHQSFFLYWLLSTIFSYLRKILQKSKLETLQRQEDWKSQGGVEGLITTVLVKMLDKKFKSPAHHRLYVHSRFKGQMRSRKASRIMIRPSSVITSLIKKLIKKLQNTSSACRLFFFFQRIL